ncbi:MAG TPA: ArdC-like ssDNA-binding domain-containing protein, partial [Thermoanaerobaculia bacterium]|nr:ArdC-like ssDNA-binding domain-containing protein [Thermoanaerobaculia bacterium]
MSPPVSIRWAELLADAVSRPGQILEAYSLFHGYSLGNQLAAMFQCRERRLAPGPIATLQRWNELKRRVRAGEKAIVLCMPVSVRVKDDERNRRPVPEGEAPRLKTIFVWKPRWFVLAQTDGEPRTNAVEIPSWDETRALETLAVQR